MMIRFRPHRLRDKDNRRGTSRVHDHVRKTYALGKASSR